MKFTKVLDDLLKGTKIRRVDWIDGDYIHLGEDEEYFVDQDGYEYTLSRDDFETEWAIYKEPLLTEEEKEILKAILKVSIHKNVRFKIVGNTVRRIALVYTTEAGEYLDFTPIIKEEYFKKLVEGEIYTLEELGL